MSFAYNPITGELDLVGASGGGGGGETVIVGTAQTVSGPTIIPIITLNLGAVAKAYQIRVEIIANATNRVAVVGAFETLTVYTDGTTATLVEAVDTQQNYLNFIKFSAYTSVSGNFVKVNAFGISNYNIDWKAILTYLQVS